METTIQLKKNGNKLYKRITDLDHFANNPIEKKCIKCKDAEVIRHFVDNANIKHATLTLCVKDYKYSPIENLSQVLVGQTYGTKFKFILPVDKLFILICEYYWRTPRKDDGRPTADSPYTSTIKCDVVTTDSFLSNSLYYVFSDTIHHVGKNERLPLKNYMTRSAIKVYSKALARKRIVYGIGIPGKIPDEL